MNTLQDQLKKWKKVNPLPIKENKLKSQKKPRPAQMSEREWKELMGIYKPTYKRHRGSFRQK
ncbi:hypothetical protein [Cytobacillus horneckiae]|uniref:Phage protein n=1 Tax=Cytobacillus horneckiae TaxID=549687 RepID=A0A2N0ZB62_9BACI|nr:hypothetical protein [Cytobacillus horneckiae]MEC1155520.1 hypothetical protein [Cytobacillus horneckiae]MED2936839.1 hypothetical protein [Cytobacillus horneckiae]PKG26740.1 hypothetical protein CWS20_22430 [Cytobacillus horneckiae]